MSEGQTVSKNFQEQSVPYIMGVPKIDAYISESLETIISVMGIRQGASLENIVRNGVRNLLEVVESQDVALQNLRGLTGEKYTRINTDEVKNIDPNKYDDPVAVAMATIDVLQEEARKLICTSDFISDVKENLDDVNPQKREEFEKDIHLARKISGKAIKAAASAYSMSNNRGITFSVSHLPDISLRQDVHPHIDRLSLYLGDG